MHLSFEGALLWLLPPLGEGWDGGQQWSNADSRLFMTGFSHA